MFNYRATVKGKVTNKDKRYSERHVELYSIVIPSISATSELIACSLTLPGIVTEYLPNDQVLVGEVDTTGEYIILGLVQRTYEVGTVKSAKIGSITASSGELSQSIKLGDDTTLRNVVQDINKLIDFYDTLYNFKLTSSISSRWEFSLTYFGSKKIWRRFISGIANDQSYILTNSISNIEGLVEQSGYWVGNSGKIWNIEYNTGCHIDEYKRIISPIIDHSNRNRYGVILYITTTDDRLPREQY